MQRVVDTGVVANDQAPRELGRGASYARDLGVGKIDLFPLRDLLHLRRRLERSQRGVVHAMRAPERLLDDEDRPGARDLVGRRGTHLMQIGRNRADVVDRETGQRQPEDLYVHRVYVGNSGDK